MPAEKLVLMRKRDADLVRALIKALKEAIPNMPGMKIDFYDLVDAFGTARKVKLLAATKESGPADFETNDTPAGGRWQSITYCDDDDNEVTKDFWVRDGDNSS